MSSKSERNQKRIKVFTSSLASMVFMCLSAQADAQTRNISMGLGLAVNPSNISGFRDVQLSDWQTHGTGIQEGRADLRFSELNRNTPILPSLEWTLGYELWNDWSFIAGINLGKQSGFLAGVEHRLWASEDFRISVLTRAGYRFYKREFLADVANAVEVQAQADKTAPIILDGEYIFPGDQLELFVGAGFGAAGLAFEYKLHRIVALRLQLAYQMTIGGETNQVTVKRAVTESDDGRSSHPEISLRLDNPAFVESGNSSTGATQSPSYNMNGFAGAITLAFNIPAVW